MKTISILGPTAVGKSSFALQLIESLRNDPPAGGYDGFDIISADSRQVYRDIGIISGADIGENFKFQMSNVKNYLNYFEHNDVRIFGVAILNYDQDWSVGQFREFGWEVINQSLENNRLPIIVGGTGLYHRHLFNDDETLSIPPSDEVRQRAEGMSVGQLQDWLIEVDDERFDQMNQSDRNNPRRLVRAIEICLASSEQLVVSSFSSELSIDDVFKIGLIDSLENIEQKIKQRVEERFENGAIDEVKNLVKHWGQVNDAIKTATGVREIKSYLDGEIDKEECLKLWSLREFQYAKRQITWWKKEEDIHWHYQKFPIY